MGCGETYTDSQGRSSSTCSSSAATACTSEPVAGSSLKNLFCQCPSPEYVNPAVNDAVFAPYLPSMGCISPMRLVGHAVVSETVIVDLSKPMLMNRSINVTLHLEGNDVDRPARWSVVNASSVQARSPWLWLPAVAGATNAHAVAAG
eukprot:120056-Prymnesium_polylepis.1